MPADFSGNVLDGGRRDFGDFTDVVQRTRLAQSARRSKHGRSRQTIGRVVDAFQIQELGHDVFGEYLNL